MRGTFCGLRASLKFGGRRRAVRFMRQRRVEGAGEVGEKEMTTV